MRHEILWLSFRFESYCHVLLLLKLQMLVFITCRHIDPHDTPIFTHFYDRSPTHINRIFSQNLHNIGKYTLPLLILKTHKPLVLSFSKGFWIFLKCLQTKSFIFYLIIFPLSHGSKSHLRIFVIVEEICSLNLMFF